MSNSTPGRFPCCHDPPMDCPSLVRERLGGDPDAAGRMLVRFGQFVDGIVRRKLGREHQNAWEDVAQDAWIRIDAGLDRWKGCSRFCAYLATITAHAAIDYLRKISRTPPISPGHDHDVAGVDPGPDELLLRKDAIEDLLKWIEQLRKKLPAKELRAWELLEEGLSRQDAATVMNCSLRTIDWYVNKIATRIARRLKALEEIEVIRKMIPHIVRILRECLGDD